MNDIEVVPVWTGADGWLIHDFGKGVLVPPYARESSLTTVTRSRASPSDYELVEEKQHAGGKPQKYSEARKVAIRELRAKGLKLREIVQRTGMPMGTIYGIVHERIGR